MSARRSVRMRSRRKPLSQAKVRSTGQRTAKTYSFITNGGRRGAVTGGEARDRGLVHIRVGRVPGEMSTVGRLLVAHVGGRLGDKRIWARRPA
jgi:hypothetical protein